jgi:four helix bundle protein
MGVRRFEDLIVWQLSATIQREVGAILDHPQVRRDGRFCEQLRDSTRSAPANIAEGFGRYSPREFVRYLRIASGSLHETKNHLHEALDRGYIDEATHERLVRLTLRALKADWRLQAYLRHATEPSQDG